MNAHFERNGIYPLSTRPAEGYGSDPATRSGKVVITHTNHKFIKVTDDGYEFVADAKDATQFDDHAEASIKAGKLIEHARANRTEVVTPEVEGVAV